jgi:hypothetical protein
MHINLLIMHVRLFIMHIVCFIMQIKRVKQIEVLTPSIFHVGLVSKSYINDGIDLLVCQIPKKNGLCG